MAADLPTVRDVLAAARRLDGVALRTPLLRSDALSEAAGTDVWLKREDQQRGGSFKLRGAYNAVASLSPADRARGIVTASAGNHGLGVAIAGRWTATPVVVYLPATAAETKRRRIARQGAEIRPVDGTYDDAQAMAERHAAECGARFVHAFSAPATVAGQGTVALEIVAELPAVAAFVVPVGGGGLVGGVGLVARALAPGARVLGAQSVETSAVAASLRAGRLVSPPMGATVCEGLSGDTDEAALRLARAVVDDVALVSEDAVRRAMRWLYEEEGVVAEGSAAVAVAAMREGAFGRLEGPVAVVVSGGNVDAARLAGVLGG
jgi:threonine dehydratase